MQALEMRGKQVERKPMVKVKNIQGTANREPRDSSTFKDHWVVVKNRPWPMVCSSYRCYNLAEVGAHVQKVGSYDRHWYIVPLCKSCNNRRGEEFWVNEDDLAPL